MRRYVRVAMVVLVVLAVFWLALPLLARVSWPDWTGFGSYTGPLTADQRGKTLWDWLELLIVPVVLALGALWFNRAEKANELKIAAQRNQNDQEIAADRQREAALQAYMDRMTELLLDSENPLGRAGENSPQRAVARTRTLTTLRMLDPLRKAALVQFLYEANLINSLIIPGMDLSGADLRGASLRGANLNSARLKGVNLSGADLQRADLFMASLSEVNLRGADLSGAWLHDADLRGADLRETNLTSADLPKTVLTGANLSGARLAEANLSAAVLDRAVLENADLQDADLRDANLCSANLKGANLAGAVLAQEQWQFAVNLDGATMPDGRTYQPAIHGSLRPKDCDNGLVMF